MRKIIPAPRLRLSCFLVTTLLELAGCGVNYGRLAPYSEGTDHSAGQVIMPANAPSITQRFRPESHDGIDIIGAIGTPILAPAAGRVVRSHLHLLYGNRIVIDHGVDSRGEHIFTMYYHLRKRGVTKDATVERGQKIGELGRTGVLGLTPHLHFGVYHTNRYGRLEAINPHLHWADGHGRVSCFDVTRHLPDQPMLLTYPLPCED